MDKQTILQELKDVIFPSKEDDGIEHIDMTYVNFISKIELLATEIQTLVVPNKPVGAATILSDSDPLESFPNHDENLPG